MMKEKPLVIYQSKYGSTRQYARWLADSLGADIKSCRKIVPDDLAKHAVIVYGGWVMGGNLAGASWLRKKLPMLKGKRLLLFAVGLAPEAPETISSLKKGFDSEIPCFYLRGRMDYSKMTLPHRVMLKIFYGMLSKQTPEQQEPWAKEFLSRFYEKNDFVERRALEPILRALA